MKKLKLEPLRPHTARGFRYLEVPRELLDNEVYADLDDGAKLIYSRMLEIAGLSAQNLDKFTDKNGRMFIYYTVEKMKHDFKRSQPTIVKLTKQLENIGLIEKVRQGQGKPFCPQDSLFHLVFPPCIVEYDRDHPGFLPG